MKLEYLLICGFVNGMPLFGYDWFRSFPLENPNELRGSSKSPGPADDTELVPQCVLKKGETSAASEWKNDGFCSWRKMRFHEFQLWF